MGTQLPSPERGGAPQFSSHVHCGQTAACIRIPLGTEVGLSLGVIVLDGNHQQPPSPKGEQVPIFGHCPLWPNGWMDQDATWYGGKPRPRRRYVRRGRSSPRKGAQPPVFGPCLCGQTAGWMKTPPGTKVDIGPSHIVLDGNPAPSPRKGHSSPPLFGPSALWPWLPISTTAEHLFIYFGKNM